MYEPMKGEQHPVLCSQEIIGPAVVWPAFWEEDWEWNGYCAFAKSRTPEVSL